MSANEPLEDDADPLPQKLKRWQRYLVLGETVIVLTGVTIGLWFTTHDKFVLWAMPPFSILMLALLIAVMRQGRFARWLNSPRKGAYRAPDQWLGAEIEAKVEQRRARITADRAKYAGQSKSDPRLTDPHLSPRLHDQDDE